MLRFSAFLIALPFWASCTAPAQRPDRSCTPAAPPILRLLVRSETAQLAAARELGPKEPARADERVLLRIALARPAYLYTVWHASAGESELLSPQILPRAPGFSVSADVPLPTFDKLHGGQTELHLYVVTSESPMEESLCALLRLRCRPDLDSSKSRGNEPEKKEESKKETTDRASRPAQPRESKPRDDRGDPFSSDPIMFPVTALGVRSAATIVPVVLKYERVN